MTTYSVGMTRMPFHQTAMLFGYFLLSGITWVYGPVGAGVLGRLSLADLWMSGIIVYCAFWVMCERRIYWSGLFTTAALLFTILLLAVLYSKRPVSGLIEWLTHGFLLLGAVAIYQLVLPLPVSARVHLIKVWMVASAILGIGIIYDGLSETLGLPILSVYHIPGAAVGTFRNSGQAGTYMGTALALGVPLLGICQRRDRLLVGLTVLICTLALFFTVKRAATVGFVLGVTIAVLVNLHRADVKKHIIFLVLAVLIVQPSVSFLTSASDHYEARLSRKWSLLRSGELENDWFHRHFSTVFELVMDRPIVGAGTGGVLGVYADKEVHSTYLSVLTSAGFLGFAVYLIFLTSMLYTFWAPQNSDERSRRLRRVLIPMVIGLLVSWAYTYHLRKREFWIMAVLAAAVMAPAPRSPALGRADDLPLSPNDDWGALSVTRGDELRKGLT